MELTCGHDGHQLTIYVSYDETDIITHWLRHELIPNIEGDQNLNVKLILASRDLRVGGCDIDSRSDAISSSNRVLALITRDYMEVSAAELVLYRQSSVSAVISSAHVCALHV